MNVNQVVCVEKYGANGTELSYVQHNGKDELTAYNNNSNKTFTTLTQFFSDVFLPQGYPNSVSNDYLQYQLWDTIQAFASSITGTLATQAVLKGVGVGDENATPLAATITWILKDGMGMVGRIMFAWVRGSDLDSNCKQWRLFADLLNDCAICMELAAPTFSSPFFSIIVCVAGLFKAIVGVAGGATRAALVQHQARRDNLADISAKDGSQETLVNLAALICSLIMLPVVSEKPMLIWTLFVIFTLLHIYTNYMAVKSVVTESFNRSRLFILLKHYTQSGELLSIKQVNYQESVFLVNQYPLKIQLGTSFAKITNSFSKLETMCSIRDPKQRYLLNLNTKESEINIVLHQDSNSATQLRACCEAMIMCICCSCAFQGYTKHAFPQLQDISAEFEQGARDVQLILTKLRQFMDNEYPSFLKAIETQGWNLQRLLLGPDEWRAEWNLDGI